MQFTRKEFAALVQMAFKIAAADGKFADEEKAAITLGLAEFGLSAAEAKGCVLAARDMDAAEALATLSGMDSSQKKFATGFLAAIIAADGDVDSSEISMWQLISTLCSFPTMQFGEAIKFWANH